MNEPKCLLTVYRNVCWSTAIRSRQVRNEIACYYSDDLEAAMIYLETFACEEKKELFEERIGSLFETKWMVELIDTAMLRVKEYPGNTINREERGRIFIISHDHGYYELINKYRGKYGISIVALEQKKSI